MCTTVSLADYHQACTRLARADYCGDGVPNTLNNTPIDVFDRLSSAIQTKASSGSEWKFEAEWGPNGAQCLGPALRADMFAAMGIEHATPACRQTLASLKDCGKFNLGRTAVLGNAYCPKWKTEPHKCGL